MEVEVASVSAVGVSSVGGVSVKVGRSAVGVVTTVSLVGGVSVNVGWSVVGVVTTVSLVGGVSVNVGRSVVGVVTTVGGVEEGLLSRKVDIKFDQGWAGVYRNWFLNLPTRN